MKSERFPTRIYILTRIFWFSASRFSGSLCSVSSPTNDTVKLWTSLTCMQSRTNLAVFSSNNGTSYLPSFPYTENPILHIYAGLICLYLSQPPEPTEDIGERVPAMDSVLLRDAQGHFERAKTIDPRNETTEVFLEKVRFAGCCIGHSPQQRLTFARKDSTVNLCTNRRDKFGVRSRNRVNG
jgi:hypothetical protein